jgi:hypothetical protein
MGIHKDAALEEIWHSDGAQRLIKMAEWRPGMSGSDLEPPPLKAVSHAPHLKRLLHRALPPSPFPLPLAPFLAVPRLITQRAVIPYVAGGCWGGDDGTAGHEA